MSLNCVRPVGYNSTKSVSSTQKSKFVRCKGSMRSKTIILYGGTRSACLSVSTPVSSARPGKNFVKFGIGNFFKLNNSESLNNRRGKSYCA